MSTTNKLLFFMLLTFCQFVSASSSIVSGTVTKLDLNKNLIEVYGIEFFIPTELILKTEEITELQPGDKVELTSNKINGFNYIETLDIRIQMFEEDRVMRLDEYLEYQEDFQSEVRKKLN